MSSEDVAASSAGTSAGDASFPSTQWTMVDAAAEHPASGREALDQLYRRYYGPLYVFALGMGVRPADAEDLVQGFFADLMRRRALSLVDRSRGRFRSFLLKAFRNYCAMQRRAARASKRGGNRAPVSLERLRESEAGRDLEPAIRETPAEQCDGALARQLFRRATEAVRREYVASGKGPLFDALRTDLWGGRGDCRYGDLARQLHATEGALEVAAHRLRKRVALQFRREIAKTLQEPEQVDEELRALLAALLEHASSSPSPA